MEEFISALEKLDKSLSKISLLEWVMMVLFAARMVTLLLHWHWNWN